MSNIAEKLDEFFRLRREISDYFGVSIYDIDDHRDCQWRANRYSVSHMDSEEEFDGEEFTYSADLRDITRHECGLVLVNARLCTGDNVYMIFSSELEVKD